MIQEVVVNVEVGAGNKSTVKTKSLCSFSLRLEWQVAGFANLDRKMLKEGVFLRALGRNDIWPVTSKLRRHSWHVDESMSSCNNAETR